MLLPVFLFLPPVHVKMVDCLAIASLFRLTGFQRFTVYMDRATLEGALTML